MNDLTTLSRDELLARRDEINAEIRRRMTLCGNCGGTMKLWMLHVCSDDGGTNFVLDSAVAKALTR
jgi:hypothetical protein